MTRASPISDPTDREVYCPHCAYNLRGVESAVCPECGLAYDRAELARTRLPWSQRARLGWFRAYWRTAVMVTFRPRALLDELAGPVVLRDARRFWVATVLLAWTPVAVGGVAAIVSQRTATSVNALNPFAAMAAAAWPVVIVGLGVLAWLGAATGFASYFCHPRRLPVERQNRAVAISYYACAPLAMLAPLSAVFGATFWIAERFNADRVSFVTGIVTVILLAWVPLAWYLRTVRVAKRAADRGARYTAMLCVALPVITVILFALLAVILPAMLIYAGLYMVS